MTVPKAIVNLTLAGRGSHGVYRKLAQSAIINATAPSLATQQSRTSNRVYQARRQDARHASALHKSLIDSNITQGSSFQQPIPTKASVQGIGRSQISMAFELVSKSDIPEIFARYAPHLDPSDYVASATVFPMRANNYVIEQLIDWRNVPDDPIFKLVFPQPAMLSESERDVLKIATAKNLEKVAMRALAEKIRLRLNPHPANQKTENVPMMNGRRMEGIQHKYRETALFFPSEGQYCHSFCTYCFRWAQFTAVGSDQAFQNSNSNDLIRYISCNKDLTDLLITGGDPMVMTTAQLEKYLGPIADDHVLSSTGATNDSIQHLATIRIGTKSLAYWPDRYVNDKSAESTLNLFSRIVRSGRHLSIMAHFSHPRELETPLVQEAIRRIRATGAQIRCQAPLIRGINDQPGIWEKMWRLQTRLGMIPYYMFIERDTGARHVFEVPLARALQIYKEAISAVAGTARTVHGPSVEKRMRSIEGIRHNGEYTLFK
ncbi:hypothetical protein CBS101457_006962 [Exobasidium rhododendri]|nr:hypothetical protein CBS101457_006962 [Exobasidium rhododendri]